jgi:hypothetical protein
VAGQLLPGQAGRGLGAADGAGKLLSWLLHLNDTGGWQSQLLEIEFAVAAVLGLLMFREADVPAAFSPAASLRGDRWTVLALALAAGAAAGAWWRTSTTTGPSVRPTSST